MCAEPLMAVPFAQYDNGYLTIFFNAEHTAAAEAAAKVAWQHEKALSCADGREGLTENDYLQVSPDDPRLQAARRSYSTALWQGAFRWQAQRARWANGIHSNGMMSTFRPTDPKTLTPLAFHHAVGRNALRHIVMEQWMSSARLADKAGTSPGLSWEHTSGKILAMPVYVHLDDQPQQWAQLPADVREALEEKVDGVRQRLRVGLGIDAEVSLVRDASHDQPNHMDSHGHVYDEHLYAYRLEISPKAWCGAR